MKKKSKRLTLDDLPPHMRQQALRQIAGDNSPNAAANMESHSGDDSVAEEVFAGDDTLCRIYIHSFRHKLADSDGISGKACVDGLVHGKILSDDSPEEVEWVRQTQEKIPKAEKEITVVRVDVYG